MKVFFVFVLLMATGTFLSIAEREELKGEFVTKTVTYDSKPIRIAGMFVPKEMWFSEGKFKMWTDQKDFSGT